MTENELRYIIAIADERNISRAAKNLFISQPSLSQALSKIEKEIGTNLFKRQKDGMELTYAGEKYYIAAKEILNIYNNFKIDVLDINNLEQGRLNFGIANFMGTHLLPKIMPLFKKSYPNIILNILEESSLKLEECVLNGSLDLAITHTHPYAKRENLSYIILDKVDFLLLAPKERDFSKYTRIINGKNYIDLSLLCDETFILLNKGKGIRTISDIIFDELKLNIKDILTTSNFETAKRLAIESCGLTLLPKDYAHLFYYKKEFSSYYILNSEEAFWQSCIILNKNIYPSKIAEVFIEHIKNLY